MVESNKSSYPEETHHLEKEVSYKNYYDYSLKYHIFFYKTAIYYI